MRRTVQIAAVLAVALLATSAVSAGPTADQSADQGLDASTIESAAAPWEYMGCH